jgi:hypothetical protein
MKIKFSLDACHTPRSFSMKNTAMKNTSKFFSFFISILMFSLLLGCASDHNKESTGEYLDDTVITTKVKAAILDDDALRSYEINVETFKGVVQLSGFVKNPDHIDRATQVTRNVNGVKSVKNDLHVK